MAFHDRKQRTSSITFGLVSSSSGSHRTSDGFMNLPIETQKEIFRQVPSRKDQLSLQRVSQHFHHLASANIYCSLRFILTHADSKQYYQLACTRLAEALNTLVTSAHDYAQYVKLFVLGLLERDTPEIQKHVLSKYHWEEEANMLLNTSLLLFLRKARILESFYWDTAIELKASVYQTLSKISTLHTFKVRLDTRAVPRTAITVAQVYPVPGQLNNQGQVVGQAYQATALTGPSAASLTGILATKEANPNIAWEGDKPRFSGFQNLHSLHIVGIDNLECLPDIATCMRGCSTTLKDLRLSTNLEMARRAHKIPTPTPTIDPAAQEAMDDDDSEDMPPPPDPAISNQIPLTDADARKEKAAQELILPMIFGLEVRAVQDIKVDKSLKAAAKSLKSKENADEAFLEGMKSMMGKMIQSKTSTGAKILMDKTIMKDLEKAVSKYINSSSQKPKKAKHVAKLSPGNHMTFEPQDESVSTQWGPSNLKNYSDDEIDKAFFTFSGLTGGKPPTSNEFKSFIHAGKLPNYTSTNALPMSYNTFPPSFFTNFSSPSTHSNANLPAVNQYPSYGSSSTHGQHLYQANPKTGGHATNKIITNKMFPPLHKAMQGQDEQDEILEQMLINEAIAEAEDEVETESEADEVEATSAGKGTIPVDLTSVDLTPVDLATMSSPVTLFPAIKPEPGDEIDDMDVDMEHPDVIESDDDAENHDTDENRNNQELAVDSTNLKMPLPLAEYAFEQQQSLDTVRSEDPSHIGQPVKSHNTPAPEEEDIPKRLVSPEETMKDYIRTKHGFHLEELTLHLVPLKPSVVARALDLSCLRRLTLLSVGQQGGFWSFLAKIQDQSAAIHLTYIHSDDVSMALLHCVANLKGLADLFLMRRCIKDTHSAMSPSPASLTDIRLLALRTHVTKLKTLMIMNNEDDSWDLDAKTLRLITAKGVALNELSFSVNITDFHVLMQGLPGLKNLVAMHIMTIRTPDQCMSITRECRKFMIDNIKHCTKLKIRYLAMSGGVFELARRTQVRKEKQRIDVKGKGKATTTGDDPTIEQTTDSDSLSDIENGGLGMFCVKHLKFSEVGGGVKIFWTRVRIGKL